MLMRVGDRGVRVSELHGLLVGHGLLDPETAARELKALHYGLETRAAVLTFQAQRGLVMTGDLNGPTWAALHEMMAVCEPAPPPAYARMGDLAAAALMRAEVDAKNHVVEQPPGSRRGPRIDEYLVWKPALGLTYLHHRPDPRWPQGHQGAPYAGLAAARWVSEGALALGRPCPLLAWQSDLQSATEWADCGFARGVLRDVAEPGRVGLIGVGRALLHVALVADVAGTTILTREADSGHRVLGRERPRSDFVVFIELEVARRPAGSTQTTCLACHKPVSECPHPESCPVIRKES